MNRDLIREYVEDRNELHAKIDRLTVERDAAILERDTALTDNHDRMADLQAEAGYLASINAVQEATISRLTAERDALADRGTLQALRDANDRAEAAERERDGLRKALEKIRDDHYPPSDLQLRDCEQPEMIWQSVARRALAATPAVSDAQS